MIRPRVREEDLELLLEMVNSEATAEAVGSWVGGNGPDAEKLSVLWACRRIRKSLKRSLAGQRAYASAKANGNLPPVLTRVEGYTMMSDGRVVAGDGGSRIYVFQGRQA